MTVKGKSQTGFTIIEVLIVLAIAGVLLAIVFLAVPALRRNYRNNARTKDASFIATQRLQYNIENKVTAGLPPGGYDCSSPITGKLFCNYVAKGLSYYDPENVTFWANGNTMPTTISTVTDPEIIRTETFLKCNATNTGAVVGAAWYDMVVLYAIETSGGTQPKCLYATVTQTAFAKSSLFVNN